MDTDGFRKALLDQGEVRQEVDRQQDRRQPPHSIGHDRQSLPPQLDRGLRRPPVRRHPVRVLQIQGRDIVELFRGFIELFYRWTRSVAQFGDKEFRCIFGEMGWGLCDARGTNCVLPAFCF